MANLLRLLGPGKYLGVAPPAGADLHVWGTRLFEYQFVADDAPLRAEVARIAPALRAHVQSEIMRCRAAPACRDDVIEARYAIGSDWLKPFALDRGTANGQSQQAPVPVFPHFAGQKRHRMPNQIR